MPVANTIINGFVPEWNEIEFSCLGSVFLGLKSIDYNSDSDGQDVMGTNSEAIARTMGNTKHTASFEMYLPDAAVLLNALGPNYRAKPFDINVSYGGQHSEYITNDVLVGCLIKNISDGHQQGSDALTRKFEIRPFRVKRSTLAGAFPVASLSDVLDPFA